MRYTGTFIPELIDTVERMNGIHGDGCDRLDDLAVQGYRIAPRWQVFCGVQTSWRVAETTPRGEFLRAVYLCDDLRAAIETAKLLNRAEALAGI